MLNYVIFLRVTPILPNIFINIASPVVNVPIGPFALGTVFRRVAGCLCMGRSSALESSVRMGRLLNCVLAEPDTVTCRDLAGLPSKQSAGG